MLAEKRNLCPGTESQLTGPFFKRKGSLVELCQELNKWGCDVKKFCKCCLKEYPITEMLHGAEFCSAICLTEGPPQKKKNNRPRCPKCGKTACLAKHIVPYCSKKCKKLHANKDVDVPKLAKKNKVKSKKKLAIVNLWSPENERKWLTLRYEVFKKYGRKCMVCNSTGSTLHVDHIKPKSKYPELAFDINNLQILCRDCNYGKSNLYEDDWR